MPICDASGDTTISVLVLARAAGCSYRDAACLANVAAGLAVGLQKLGTAVGVSLLGNWELGAGSWKLAYRSMGRPAVSVCTRPCASPPQTNPARGQQPATLG